MDVVNCGFCPSCCQYLIGKVLTRANKNIYAFNLTTSSKDQKSSTACKYGMIYIYNCWHWNQTCSNIYLMKPWTGKFSGNRDSDMQRHNLHEIFEIISDWHLPHVCWTFATNICHWHLSRASPCRIEETTPLWPQCVLWFFLKKCKEKSNVCDIWLVFCVWKFYVFRGYVFGVFRVNILRLCTNHLFHLDLDFLAHLSNTCVCILDRYPIEPSTHLFVAFACVLRSTCKYLLLVGILLNLAELNRGILKRGRCPPQKTTLGEGEQTASSAAQRRRKEAH